MKLTYCLLMLEGPVYWYAQTSKVRKNAIPQSLRVYDFEYPHSRNHEPYEN